MIILIINKFNINSIHLHLSLGENDVPQLHPTSAFGFATTSNPYLIISDLKSIVEPFMKSSVVSSTMTCAPSFSNILYRIVSLGWYLSFSVIASTILKLYWNPEQPPESTKIFRYFLLGSLAWSYFIFYKQGVRIWQKAGFDKFTSW